MNKVFKHLIGKCMVIYVDDMIVKNIVDEVHATDVRKHSLCSVSMA